MTTITRVKTHSGVTEFANAAAGAAYARKHGGKILNAGNAGLGSTPETANFPTPSPGLCSLLGLSIVALQDRSEVQAAFTANGGSGPQHREKIIAGLVNYFMSKTGGSTDEIISMLKERHPSLFLSGLAKLAGTSGGANERQPIMAANEGPGLILADRADDGLSTLKIKMPPRFRAGTTRRQKQSDEQS